MRIYPDQPNTMEETKPLKLGMERLEAIVKEVLEADLPDCPTNEWFLQSVNFPNMTDKIMERIWMEV